MRFRAQLPKQVVSLSLKLAQLKSPSRPTRNDGVNCQLYPAWTPPTAPADFIAPIPTKKSMLVTGREAMPPPAVTPR